MPVGRQTWLLPARLRDISHNYLYGTVSKFVFACALMYSHVFLEDTLDQEEICQNLQSG